MPFSLFPAIISLAHSELVPFVFALGIGVPSAVLYCAELWVIIANFAEFNSAFFVMVIMRATLSLLNYGCSFFEQRFGKIGLFLPLYLKLPRPVLASLFFVTRYVFHEENLLTALLLLNRFTSILLPIKYEKLWRHALFPILIFTIVLPLPFTAQIFNLDMYIHVQHDNVTFTLDNKERTSSNDNTSYSFNAVCSALSFALICLFINLASLFAFKFCRPKNAGHQSNQNNKNDALLERKMTIYTVSTFFGQFMMANFMIILYMTSATRFVVGQNDEGHTLAQTLFGIDAVQNELVFLANYNQYPWVNDLSTVVIPAWLLLWASSKMRKIMCKKFVRKAKNVVSGKKSIKKMTVKKVQPIVGNSLRENNYLP